MNVYIYKVGRIGRPEIILRHNRKCSKAKHANATVFKLKILFTNVIHGQYRPNSPSIKNHMIRKLWQVMPNAQINEALRSLITKCSLPSSFVLAYTELLLPSPTEVNAHT